MKGVEITKIWRSSFYLIFSEGPPSVASTKGDFADRPGSTLFFNPFKEMLGKLAISKWVVSVGGPWSKTIQNFQISPTMDNKRNSSMV